ncbi:TPA: hypothetical protein ACRNDU_006123 [Pseudomonas aeruginosa]|jgi:hypothetical protein|uniref:Uncharacterized protein n=1 Tax=Pseudomonas juntendi TaxID=2666183 RepID=A0ABD4YLT3_9PSED|nr:MULTISPECIES: hypothetical protein [Pseudomonas]MCE0946090.1 hypothetical protein [Pseudomonas asiatica]MCE1004296.1 hypothetical protein [Pseudomonas sp. NMI1173_11]MCE1066927.1 hypothetical protein [Pseudomonas asiatica]MDH0760242.1 hypothetical protein [Pseudomonas juntendi]MDH1921516.1 hypothetical protein [Pseudomonas juntendi]
MNSSSTAKAYIVETRATNGAEDTPEFASFSIDLAATQRIINLARLVKENGLHKVETFDSTASFHQYAPGTEEAEEIGCDNDVLLKAGCLNVDASSFWFSGFIRHSDVEVVSARQPIAELQSHFHLAGGTTELEAGGERQYLVTWSADVEVEGDHHAAAQAVADRYFRSHIAAGEQDSACTFVVTAKSDQKPVEIDLSTCHSGEQILESA